MSDKKDKKDCNLTEALLVGAALGLFMDDESAVQELHDEGYSPEEIADDLDMDEEEVKDILGEDDRD